MVMNRYDRIISLGDEFLKLIKEGFISITVLDWKVYYEYYLEEVKRGNKKDHAALNTAVKYDISKRTVYSAIKWMENY